MDELVKAVSQRTGLSEDQSRQAAQAVLDFLMTKLPPPVAEQIKSALSGKAPDVTELGKNLGGMLGKR